MNDPIDFIVSYFREKSDFDELGLQLSYYEYKPQTVMDKRTVIDRLYPTLDRADIEDIVVNCPAGQEVAFHSLFTVKENNRTYTYHLPMIDFCCGLDSINRIASLAKRLLPEKIWKTLYFFNSGRSLHGYSTTELKPAEFIDFMGRCLLMNLPSEPPVVDSRWIGHRIMAGYGSLRISHNTPQYLSAPKFLGTIANYI